MIEPKGKGGLISTGDYDSFCFTPKGTGAHKSSFLFLFICSDGYVRLEGELESEKNWGKGESGSTTKCGNQDLDMQTLSSVMATPF